MPTSKAKAARRLERGLPSKLTPQKHSASRTAARAITGRVMKKSAARRNSNLSVSPSGASSRGMAATVPARVSHAHRGDKDRSRTRVSDQVRRKRVRSKTANPGGRYSTPDVGAVFDSATAFRAKGRANKHTAQVERLRHRTRLERTSRTGERPGSRRKAK